MVTEPSVPVAGPSSLPSPGTSAAKSKSRRKRSAAGTPPSSSSVSASKLARNDERRKPDSKARKKRKAKEKEKGKDGEEYKSKERYQERAKSKSKQKSKTKQKSRKETEPRVNGKSFDTAADFIALLDSDEDSRDVRRDEKEKRKDNANSDRQRNGRKRSRSRSLERRDRDRHKDRNRDRKGKGRERTPEREWDRGKRKDRDRNNRRDQPVSASVRPIEDIKLPWLAGVDLLGCHNVAELLHKEVEAFTKWISPSPVEDEIRSLLVESIKGAITSRFSDAQVLPFGSYATKLYLPTGDIDLVVMSRTMVVTDKHVVLRSLAEVIKRSGIASTVSIIAKAKVPLVKFTTTLGHIPVDISINQGNGAVGAGVVNGFLRDLSTTTSSTSAPASQAVNLEGSIALRALVMITKMFLSQRSMNEVYTGGLGSYSIVSLVISFLQMHPKIRRGEIDADQNLGVLLIEFFELYGSYFNYDNVGISVRDGGTYFNKRQRGWYNDNSSNYKGRGGASTLSIEDPIDISNDISSGSYAFSKVRATFAGAHQILTATAYLKAGILSARHSGRSADIRRDDHEFHHTEEMSVLAHIIDITQDIINKRRVVQEIYDQRTLHNLLHVKPKVVVVEDPRPSSSSKTNGYRAPVVSNGRRHQITDSDLEEGELSMDEVRVDGDHSSPPRRSGRRHRDLSPRTKRDARDSDSNSNSTSDDEGGDDGDEDSGKYGIKARGRGRSEKDRKVHSSVEPPKKRLKTGGSVDLHTVFTSFSTDDEEGEEEDDSSEDSGEDEDEDGDSVAREEAEYDIDVDFDDVEDDKVTKGVVDVDQMGVDAAGAGDVMENAKDKQAPVLVPALPAEEANTKGAEINADLVALREAEESPDNVFGDTKAADLEEKKKGLVENDTATMIESRPSPPTTPGKAEKEEQLSENKDKRPPLGSGKNERKRSYWLSKGIGAGDDGGVDGYDEG